MQGEVKGLNAVLATARSMRILKYKQKLMTTGLYSLLLTLVIGNILRILANVLPVTLIDCPMKVIGSCDLKRNDCKCKNVNKNFIYASLMDFFFLLDMDSS